jgi:hypothetical protein
MEELRTARRDAATAAKRRRALAICIAETMVTDAEWCKREKKKKAFPAYIPPTDEHLAKAKELLGDIRRLYGEGKPVYIPPLPVHELPPTSAYFYTGPKSPKSLCLGTMKYGHKRCFSECTDEENGMTAADAFKILSDAVSEKKARNRLAKQRAALRAIGGGQVAAAYRRDHPEKMAGKEEQIADTPGNGGPIGNNDESSLEMDSADESSLEMDSADESAVEMYYSDSSGPKVFLTRTPKPVSNTHLQRRLRMMEVTQKALLHGQRSILQKIAEQTTATERAANRNARMCKRVEATCTPWKCIHVKSGKILVCCQQPVRSKN